MIQRPVHFGIKGLEDELLAETPYVFRTNWRVNIDKSLKLVPSLSVVSFCVYNIWPAETQL